MASASDTSGAPARARSIGQGLRLAGDRTALRTVAKRHSRRVRFLKYALPISALTALALYAGAVVNTVGWGTGLSALTSAQIIPENLVMENPHYDGYATDGGRYWVKAAKAQQELPNMNIVKLETITGELTDAQKAKTSFAAARGTFDSKANLLELFEKITISGDGGLSADLTRATVKTKEGLITSDQPVKVGMAAGVITAKQVTIRQKAKEYTFVDDVRAVLAPKKTDSERAAAAPPQGVALPVSKSPAAFGASNEPVTITASRLDVNDVAKSALFSGSVVADQAGAQLSAPELEVTYDGGAAPGVAAASAGGGKLKRILAKNTVELRQAGGETATGQTLDFDAEKQTTVLEGDVVITQAPDRRVTGDRADFDQKSDVVILTGVVSLNQGPNALRGGRLAFNRTTSVMQLTAPGAAGRIFARFQQPNTGQKPEAAPALAGAQKGIPFAATFKTNPDAPVSIESATLDVDDAAKQAVFRGKVRAVQGDFVIQSSELTAAYSGSAGLAGGSPDAGKQSAAQLTRLKARSNVQITSNDGQKATGDWADFDTRANIATLGGDVVLTQGKNVVRGTKLVIDMTSGQTVMNTEPATAGAGARISNSGGDGAGQIVKSQRPSAVLYPGEMKGQQAKPPAANVVEGWQQRSQP